MATPVFSVGAIVFRNLVGVVFNMVDIFFFT